jgi:diguanylate cyclase (GGDEF)-like protein
MLTLETYRGSTPSILPERIGSKVTAAHVITLALMALLTFGAYASLLHALSVQRAATNATAITSRQLMLSQRIASLTAQYALGNGGIRADLRAAITDFERIQWSLVAGDQKLGIVSAVIDPQLKRIYFDGPAPLDAAAIQFVSRARRIAGMSPQSAALGAQTAPLFGAAQQPLVDGIDAAQQVRQAHVERDDAILRELGLGTVLSMLLALLAATLTVFRPMAQQIVRLTNLAHDLAAQATTDPITGMLNKRSFQARAAIEIQKARRYQRPLALLRIDADQLQAIEDTYGRDGGDSVLRALTSSFFDGTRISDLLARVDDEQFAILLPETTAEGAELLAERLRRKINDLCVPIDDDLVSCTISVGVAAAEKDAAFLWPTFKRADQAVYEAKARGRNQVVVATSA